MKFIQSLTLLTLISLLAIPAGAQVKVEVKEGSVPLESGRQNGFSIILNTDDVKEVESEWKSVLKKFDGKVEGKLKKELFADDAEISAISSNTIDIYSIGREVGKDKVELSVCFDLGGVYLSSSVNKEAAKEAIKILEDFGKEFQKNMLEKELKAQEKALKELEKEHEGLVKDKEKYEKDIEDAKELIEKRKKEIEENIKDQATKSEEIKSQEKVIEELEKELKKYK